MAYPIRVELDGERYMVMGVQRLSNGEVVADADVLLPNRRRRVVHALQLRKRLAKLAEAKQGLGRYEGTS